MWPIAAQGHAAIVTRDEYMHTQALNRFRKQAGQWRLQIAVVSADVDLSNSIDASRLGVQAMSVDIVVPGGPSFEFKDATTRFIPITTTVSGGNANSQFQSGESSRSTGFIVAGRLVADAGRVNFVGTYELSQATSTDTKSEKSQSVDLLLTPGKWIKMTSITSAQAALLLKPLRASVGGGVYRLWIRVVEEGA